MKKTYRKSVFIVVYRKQNNQILYLLLKRKLHWRGWEFPKGGIEKESLIQAAKRETKEETGLKPIKIRKFKIHGKYKYHKFLADRPNYLGQSYILFSAEVKDGKIKIDKREHSAFKWLEFNKAIKLLKWPNQKKSMRIVNNSI